MKPEFSDEHISAYLDGELTAEETRQVEQLLIDSREHRQVFSELRDMRSKLRALPQEQLPADFSDRVLAMAKTEIAQAEDSQTAPMVVSQEPAKISAAPPRPSQTGWIAAVSLAAASAAAVLGLLAFPPVLPELQNPVAMAPVTQENARSTRLDDSNGEQSGGLNKKEEQSRIRLMVEDESGAEQMKKKGVKEIGSNDVAPTEKQLRSTTRSAEFNKSRTNKKSSLPGESDAKGVESYSVQDQPGGESPDRARDVRYRKSDFDSKSNEEAPPSVSDDDQRGAGMKRVSGSGGVATVQSNLEIVNEGRKHAPGADNEFSDEFRSFAQLRMSEVRLAVIEVPDSSRGLKSLTASLGKHAVALDRVEASADSIAYEAKQGEARSKDKAQPAVPEGYELAVLEGNADDIAQVLEQWKARPATFAYDHYANGKGGAISDAQRQQTYSRLTQKESDETTLRRNKEPLAPGNGSAGAFGGEFDAEAGAGGYGGEGATPADVKNAPTAKQKPSESNSTPDFADKNEGEAQPGDPRPATSPFEPLAAKPQLTAPSATPQTGDSKKGLGDSSEVAPKEDGEVREGKNRNEQAKRKETKKIRLLVLIRTRPEAQAAGPAQADAAQPEE